MKKQPPGPHVSKQLSSHLQGELSPQQSRQVSEHLLRCRSCRDEYGWIKLGVEAARQLPRVPAPESMWSEIESRLNNPEPAAASLALKPYFYLAAAALIALAVGWGVMSRLSAPWQPSQKVVRLQGAPVVGSDVIRDSADLQVGAWLVTDENSRARIEVGDIGRVEVEPGSRVRLLKSSPSEQRLSLGQGKIHASIWAPPRLFFVETPSALAVDLGCVYSLEVQPAGDGLLQVRSGWVGLQRGDREVLVPAGASCRIDARSGPGIPYFDNASETFRRILSGMEDGLRESGGLEQLLSESRRRDTLTLWYLLFQLDLPQRGSVYERMQALAPAPLGVSRESVRQLDKPSLYAWRDHLERSILGPMQKGKKGKKPVKKQLR